MHELLLNLHGQYELFGRLPCMNTKLRLEMHELLINLYG